MTQRERAKFVLKTKISKQCFAKMALLNVLKTKTCRMKLDDFFLKIPF